MLSLQSAGWDSLAVLYHGSEPSDSVMGNLRNSTDADLFLVYHDAFKAKDSLKTYIVHWVTLLMMRFSFYIHEKQVKKAKKNFSEHLICTAPQVRKVYLKASVYINHRCIRYMLVNMIHHWPSTQTIEALRVNLPSKITIQMLYTRLE